MTTYSQTEKPMTRHAQREELMKALYTYLLLHTELADVLQQLRTSNEEANTYFYDVIEVLMDKEDDYADFIGKQIVNWDYDRLGYVERAILLVALAEYKGLNYDKAVVIDEAVRLAKKYCDEDTYKLINGVLDKA